MGKRDGEDGVGTWPRRQMDEADLGEIKARLRPIRQGPFIGIVSI